MDYTSYPPIIVLAQSSHLASLINAKRPWVRMTTPAYESLAVTTP